MSVFRKLVAGLFCAGLASATGVALVAARAATIPASAPIPVRPALEAPAAAPEAPASPVESSVEAPAAERPAARPAARRAASASSAVDAELACLTRVILYEAGNQPRRGQLAVAQVVMNRVRSPLFPNTICSVINQRGQFSRIRSFHAPRDARWRRALAIARDARAGTSAPVVGRALYFHAARIRPGFARSRTRVAAIGDHVFYR